MNFALTERLVLLSHCNFRKERHGEDDVDAADLKFEVDLPMADLQMFHGALQGVLYDQEKPDVAGAFTVLRFPKLEPIRWSDSVEGGEVVVHYGMSHMTLANARVDKFLLEARDGGTVALTFRVQFHPSEDQAGKLATSLLGTQVPITIRPPISAA